MKSDSRLCKSDPVHVSDRRLSLLGGTVVLRPFPRAMHAASHVEASFGFGSDPIHSCGNMLHGMRTAEQVNTFFELARFATADCGS